MSLQAIGNLSTPEARGRFLFCSSEYTKQIAPPTLSRLFHNSQQTFPHVLLPQVTAFDSLEFDTRARNPQPSSHKKEQEIGVSVD